MMACVLSCCEYDWDDQLVLVLGWQDERIIMALPPGAYPRERWLVYPRLHFTERE